MKLNDKGDQITATFFKRERRKVKEVKRLLEKLSTLPCPAKEIASAAAEAIGAVLESVDRAEADPTEAGGEEE
jgi:hypothetical protein